MRYTLPIFGLLAVLALPVRAAEFLATNAYRVAESQTVADEQWVLAGTAEAEGRFQNDLFISSGGALLLNGTYEGNVWGASGLAASMDGHCLRNVRLAGKTVRIDGHVAGNVMAMAETVILGTNAVVEGNVRLIATSVIQEGLVKGNAAITSARTATLGGTIKGNVKIVAPEVFFARDAQIDGNLAYTANKELVPAAGVVAGAIERQLPKAEPLFSKERLYSRAMWFLAAFLAGVPFIALFPMTTAMAAQLARTSAWKCLLVGMLATAALPFLAIMCASSIVGIPLGGLILAVWGILIYVSRFTMGLVVGTMILRSVGTSIRHVLLTMALGLAVIYLATVFPPIAVPAQMAVAWMGTGALLLALLQKRRLIIQVPQNLKKLEELKNEANKPEEQ
ncbi:bactofilin family protein [Pontiella sulfatireligans]|uniref:Polymer-forming cytoskeletal n=1 Tax=Pontiella sulfatireligans TaxID=2750658 RepID=A0A6C2UNE5_9BACT|nr:polymer-forming cytoskeletal protein [Pontiella sulfatireligans]VGO21800.1 hypothetical protein SCARR_03877 [Pontiella sulfatireligans]